jgi:hypothetical protein
MTPPRRLSARWVFIHLFLLVQLALPVSYFFRQDRYDERFAWRMFSAERMVKCETKFLLGEERKELPLDGLFHTAWLEMAQRGRKVVVEEMAARVCHDHPGLPLRVGLRCVAAADRSVDEVSRGVFDVCPSGKL